MNTWVNEQYCTQRVCLFLRFSLAYLNLVIRRKRQKDRASHSVEHLQLKSFITLIISITRPWVVETAGIELRIHKGEASKLVLIDCAEYVSVHRSQNGLFFRELRIKVQRVFLVFLEM